MAIRLSLSASSELDTIRTLGFSRIDKQDARYLMNFLSQMDELIEAALSINKPIVF
jgi:hypothetical protein